MLPEVWYKSVDLQPVSPSTGVGQTAEDQMSASLSLLKAKVARRPGSGQSSRPATADSSLGDAPVVEIPASDARRFETPMTHSHGASPTLGIASSGAVTPALCSPLSAGAHTSITSPSTRTAIGDSAHHPLAFGPSERALPTIDGVGQPPASEVTAKINGGADGALLPLATAVEPATPTASAASPPERTVRPGAAHRDAPRGGSILISMPALDAGESLRVWDSAGLSAGEGRAPDAQTAALTAESGPCHNAAQTHATSPQEMPSPPLLPRQSAAGAPLFEAQSPPTTAGPQGAHSPAQLSPLARGASSSEAAPVSPGLLQQQHQLLSMLLPRRVADVTDDLDRAMAPLRARAAGLAIRPSPRPSQPDTLPVGTGFAGPQESTQSGSSTGPSQVITPHSIDSTTAAATPTGQRSALGYPLRTQERYSHEQNSQSYDERHEAAPRPAAAGTHEQPRGPSGDALAGAPAAGGGGIGRRFQFDSEQARRNNPWPTSSSDSASVSPASRALAAADQHHTTTQNKNESSTQQRYSRSLDVAGGFEPTRSNTSSAAGAKSHSTPLLAPLGGLTAAAHSAAERVDSNSNGRLGQQAAGSLRGTAASPGGPSLSRELASLCDALDVSMMSLERRVRGQGADAGAEDGGEISSRDRSDGRELLGDSGALSPGAPGGSQNFPARPAGTAQVAYPAAHDTTVAEVPVFSARRLLPGDSDGESPRTDSPPESSITAGTAFASPREPPSVSESPSSPPEPDSRTGDLNLRHLARDTGDGDVDVGGAVSGQQDATAHDGLIGADTSPRRRPLQTPPPRQRSLVPEPPTPGPAPTSDSPSLPLGAAETSGSIAVLSQQISVAAAGAFRPLLMPGAAITGATGPAPSRLLASALLQSLAPHPSYAPALVKPLLAPLSSACVSHRGEPRRPAVQGLPSLSPAKPVAMQPDLARRPSQQPCLTADGLGTPMEAHAPPSYFLARPISIVGAGLAGGVGPGGHNETTVGFDRAYDWPSPVAGSADGLSADASFASLPAPPSYRRRGADASGWSSASPRVSFKPPPQWQGSSQLGGEQWVPQPQLPTAHSAVTEDAYSRACAALQRTEMVLQRLVASHHAYMPAPARAQRGDMHHSYSTM